VALDGGVGALGNNQYDVLMEPTDQRWAFSLENSMAVSDNVFDAGEDLFRFRRPADSAVRYRLAVEPGQVQNNRELSPAMRQRYLQLPSDSNPRARELA